MLSARRHSHVSQGMSLLLVLGMIGILVLAGCGSRPAATEAIEEESELIIAQGVDATTLDPNMHAEAPTTNVVSNIYDSLLIRDEDGEIRPSLAESLSNVDDHTWELTLRDDVEFHNGEPFDAESVRYTIKRILDPENNSPQAGDLSAIKHVEVLDDYTVRLITHQPFPTLPAQLVDRQMVPPIYTEEKGADRLSSQPVGTGPYRFVSWKRDEKIVLEANEDYWRGTPSIKKVVFRVVPENSTRIAELQAGKVDLIVNVPPHQAEDLESSPDTRVERVPSTRVIFVATVSDEPGPLADPRVRRALNLAVDAESIIDSVLQGNGIPLQGQPVTENHFGFNPAVDPSGYDPQKARDLLAEAGYQDGLSLEMDTPDGRYLMDKEVAQAVAGQLQQVGVDVSLNIREWGVFVERIMNRQTAPLVLVGWGNSTFDADATVYPWFRTGQRFCFYENAEVDQLLDDARETMDEEARLQTYHQVMEILSDDAPWIFLHQQMDIYGVSERLDWTARPDERIEVFDADIR